MQFYSCTKYAVLNGFYSCEIKFLQSNYRCCVDRSMLEFSAQNVALGPGFRTIL